MGCSKPTFTDTQKLCFAQSRLQGILQHTSHEEQGDVGLGAVGLGEADQNRSGTNCLYVISYFL